MQHVLSKVKELGIDVQFLELEKDGYSTVEMSMIIINQCLCEEK